jgi:Spy/CpxP family protein refolding chaperone
MMTPNIPGVGQLPRRARGAALGLVFAILLAQGQAEAQGGGGMRPGARDVPPRGLGGQQAARRERLEQRLQQRIDQVVRERLALTDEQVAKLREAAGKIDADRRGLQREELSTRAAIRAELLAGEKANEARVAELLDRIPKLERRRIDLMEQEQRELAKFLTASQRARYVGLQDELRRSMQDMQRRGADRPPPPDDANAERPRRRPPPAP